MTTTKKTVTYTTAKEMQRLPKETAVSFWHTNVGQCKLTLCVAHHLVLKIRVKEGDRSSMPSLYKLVARLYSIVTHKNTPGNHMYLRGIGTSLGTNKTHPSVAMQDTVLSRLDIH